MVLCRDIAVPSEVGLREIHKHENDIEEVAQFADGWRSSPKGTDECADMFADDVVAMAMQTDDPAFSEY